MTRTMLLSIAVMAGIAWCLAGFASIVVIGIIGLALDGGLRLLAVPVGHWQQGER